MSMLYLSEEDQRRLWETQKEIQRVISEFRPMKTWERAASDRFIWGEFEKSEPEYSI